MSASHRFNLIAFCKLHGLDFYGFIKLVNFIRKKGLDENEANVVNLFDFSSDEFLMPVIVDDGLLQIDFDGLLERHCENGGGTADDEEKQALEERLKEAERKAAAAEENLTRAVNDLERFKKEMRSLLLQSAHNSAVDAEQGKACQDESKAYFESYAHHGIHEEMLKDKVRTEAYRDFILSNEALFKDKIVLDIGCGTGILSMFAAKAGAKTVIAVDQSDIVYQAMDIIRENNLDGVIKVIKGNAETINLPEGIKKVDLIISEWMGYFLLFESMLDSVIRCREKWLAKDGLVIPDLCKVFLVTICDERMWESKVGFWSQVYGYTMSCMRKYALEEPLIEVVQNESVCSHPAEVLSLDCSKAKLNELEFASGFTMEVTKSGICTGVVGYFDIGFEKNAQNPISFSTGCHAPPTHWKQTVFLFEDKVELVKGELLRGNIVCKKDDTDKRALTIKLNIERGDGSLIVDKLYSLR